MLIIHPPLTKPCEPPAAPAYLSGHLQAHGQTCTVCDMNIEGLYTLLNMQNSVKDTWSKRAFKNTQRNIAALQNAQTYSNLDRYKRAVADVNRVLEIVGHKYDLQLSLSNYHDNQRSSLSSGDLISAAEEYEHNIYYPYFSRRFEELLSVNSHDYIGFSLCYLSQALCTFAMVGFLRKRYPQKKIIFGGGLVTTWLSNSDWQNPFTGLVDIFIAGKGEEPLLNLLQVAPKTVYAKPDYSGLMNRYLSPGFILPYTSSTGCFWKKCNFCPETSEDNPYLHVPSQTTVENLRTLSIETNPTLIHLLDNAVSPQTFRALVESPPPVPWYGFARFESLLADAGFCHDLRASGCTMLKLGLESGDQKVLDNMNKGIDLELASKVLANLKNAGIATYVYLLFGTPAETLAEAEKTLKFVEDHSQAISFLNLAIFNLPVGSTEVANLEVSSFYEGDLSIYRNFTHPRGWDRGEVRRFLDSRFKKSPGISRILQRDPPLFTSNHAPFL